MPSDPKPRPLTVQRRAQGDLSSRSHLDSQQFISALNLMLGEEGGFSNRPLADDPGGPTYRGITGIGHEEYHRPRSRGGRAPGSARHPLTNAEVRLIYGDIWRRTGAKTLPAGLDEAFFNAAVMSGDNTAKELLATTRNPREFVEAHRRYLLERPNIEANRSGWMSRLDRLNTRIGE